MKMNINLGLYLTHFSLHALPISLFHSLEVLNLLLLSLAGIAQGVPYTATKSDSLRVPI
jgi:hypothetical protein